MKASLVDLARENSSEKRRELLQEVSDLFVEGAEAHSDRETMLFGDVLGKLLDQAPLDDRVTVSSKVAALVQTPRELALQLANDDSAVAAPVLRHSPVLTDSDLVDLAKRKSLDHLQAISQRATLSEAVTDVLVDRGDSAVLNTVTRNLGARFSDQGFETLAAKSEGDNDLGEALSFRADMPPGVAQGLVARLNPAARQRLEHLMSQNWDAVDEIIDQARREMEGSRTDHRRSRLESKVMVADVREGKRSVNDVLDQLIMKKRILDAAYVLSELASVPEAHVNNVLHKVNPTGIAVVCRSLDIAETTYDRLTRVRCEKLKLNAAQVEPMVRDYRALDKATAERAIRFHKVRSTVSRVG
ncbi:DUF2336 domain-containing protein [Prosthecomicrobium sp. N25]|uniref:DUF2336 domain-containing protein n=1 Tax=Prosthecomicrobium sp. N25 TaxID=3129254 RepID=UPI003078A407